MSWGNSSNSGDGVISVHFWFFPSQDPHASKGITFFLSFSFTLLMSVLACIVFLVCMLVCCIMCVRKRWYKWEKLKKRVWKDSDEELRRERERVRYTVADEWDKLWFEKVTVPSSQAIIPSTGPAILPPAPLSALPPPPPPPRKRWSSIEEEPADQQWGDTPPPPPPPPSPKDEEEEQRRRRGSSVPPAAIGARRLTEATIHPDDRRRRHSSAPPPSTGVRFRTREGARARVVKTNPAATNILLEDIAQDPAPPTIRPPNTEEMELGFPWKSVVEGEDHDAWLEQARRRQKKSEGAAGAWNELPACCVQ